MHGCLIAPSANHDNEHAGYREQRHAHGDCAKNQHSSFLRKRLCKKPSPSRVTCGKPLRVWLFFWVPAFAGTTNVRFLHSLESRKPTRRHSCEGDCAKNPRQAVLHVENPCRLGYFSGFLLSRLCKKTNIRRSCTAPSFLRKRLCNKRRLTHY